MMTITGHFGKPNTLAPLQSLIGQFFGVHDIGVADDLGYEGGGRLSPVVGARIVGGLVPCNVIPEEILTDHPNRYRALWVESGNPCHFGGLAKLASGDASLGFVCGNRCIHD